jgi:hypothetical protein
MTIAATTTWLIAALVLLCSALSYRIGVRRGRRQQAALTRELYEQAKSKRPDWRVPWTRRHVWRFTDGESARYCARCPAAFTVECPGGVAR